VVNCADESALKQAGGRQNPLNLITATSYRLVRTGQQFPEGHYIIRLEAYRDQLSSGTTRFSPVPRSSRVDAMITRTAISAERLRHVAGVQARSAPLPDNVVNSNMRPAGALDFRRRLPSHFLAALRPGFTVCAVTPAVGRCRSAVVSRVAPAHRWYGAPPPRLHAHRSLDTLGVVSVALLIFTRSYDQTMRATMFNESHNDLVTMSQRAMNALQTETVQALPPGVSGDTDGAA